MAVDASGAIWACSPNGGVYKSTNQGNNWQSVEGFNQITSQGDQNVLSPNAITIDDNGTIYVGTGNLYFDRALFGIFHAPVTLAESLEDLTTTAAGYKGMIGGRGNGVFVSKDGGETFDNATATRVFPFPTVVYDFSDPWIMVNKMLAVGGRVFAATGNGVWYSDDQFETVNESTHPFADSTITLDETVLDLAVGANGRIFAATPNAIFISDDNGETFQTRKFGLDFPRDEQDVTFGSYRAENSRRVTVAVAPSDPSIIYCAEVSTSGLLWGVWKSTDNGDSWTAIGPRSSAFDVINGVASQSFAPLTPSGFSDGIGRYALMLEIDAQDPEHVYLAGDKWYEYTPKNGWRRNETRNINLFPGDPKYVPRAAHCLVHNTDGSAFYVGSDGPVIRSADQGNSFAQRTNGLQVAKVMDVAVKLDGSVLGSSYPVGAINRPGNSGANWTIINRFLQPEINNIQTSIVEPDQAVVSVMSLATNFGGGVERSFDGLVSSEPFCSTPDTAFGDFLTDLGWATGTEDTCSAITLPEEAHHQFSPYKLVEYVDPNGDSVVVDTLNQVLADRYVFSGNAFGVYMTERPFWTAADEGEQTYTTRITPNFDEENYGAASALDVTTDGSFTVYVGTEDGRIFRIDNANTPNDTDNFAFTELTPSTGEFTGSNARYISQIRINPNDDSQVLVTMGAYHNRENSSNNIHLIVDANTDNPEFIGQQGNVPFCPVYDAIWNAHPETEPGWDVMIATEFGIFTSTELVEIPGGLASADWVANAVDFGSKRMTTYGLDYMRYERELVTYDNSERVAYRLVEKPFSRIYAATAGGGVYSTSINLTNRSVDDDNFADLSDSEIMKAYPNPARDVVNVSIDLPYSADIAYTVRNIAGQTVAHNSLGQQNKGMKVYSLSTADLSNGLYLLEVELQKGGQSIRMNKKVLVQH